MMDLKRVGVVDLANSECRAGDLILATRTSGNPTHHCCLAATQVANQLNNFTALQRFAELLAELLGRF